MKKTYLLFVSLLIACLTISAFAFEQPRYHNRRPPVHRRTHYRHNHPNLRRFYPRTCPACGEIARYRRAHRYHSAPPPRVGRRYHAAPRRHYRSAPPRQNYRSAPPQQNYRSNPAPRQNYRSNPAPSQRNNVAPRQGQRQAPPRR